MSSLKTLLPLLVLISGVIITGSTLFADQIGSHVKADVFYGDANGDGRIDLADVDLLGRHLEGTVAVTVSHRNLDFDRNGTVDKDDLTLLGRVLGEAPTGEISVAVEVERVILGDANDDGSIDLADVLAIAFDLFQGVRYAAPAEAADVNGDRVVDDRDLGELVRYFFGNASIPKR